MAVDDDLRALIARIEATFGSDIDAWLGCFDAPMVVVRAEGTVTFPDRAAARGFFDRMYEALAARGFASTEADAVRIRVVTGDLALVDADFTRRRADGSELERIGALYLCRRSPDGWRVATLISRPPDAPAID
jgi:hypothetical protein